MVFPPSGSLIAGKYRIESLLGEGGMGAVFRARHEIMDKSVAVKWLKPTSGDEAAARHRFMQEARAAARIRHPNVVDVYDVGEQDGCLFMVMELLEGETFGDFLERSGIPVAEAMRHLLAAMRGVAAAHAAGITHRDIKPENVFIAVDALHVEGVAKILDFGISKLHDEPQPHLTLAGITMGTPHYMSYEQIRCMSDVDHRTDIYAFGVLLYQALTGALPYDADTLPGIVMQAATGRAVRPIELCPDLPPELDELVMKAIALRPDDRFQTMDAMINALTRIQLARYAWSASTLRSRARVRASTERASWTPRSQQAAVLLLKTPRPPDSDLGSRAEEPRASALAVAPPALVLAPAQKAPALQRLRSWLALPRQRLAALLGSAADERASTSPRPDINPKAAPLNPWLGLVGVALGLLLGGSLYTRLMTPTPAASGGVRASAPALTGRTPALVDVGAAPGASLATALTTVRASAEPPLAPTAYGSSLAPGSTSLTADNADKLVADSPSSLVTDGPSVQGPDKTSAPASTHVSSAVDEPHASTAPAVARGPRSPAVPLAAHGPAQPVSKAPQPQLKAGALGVSPTSPTQAPQPREARVDEQAPSSSPHAHRSGPLKLEEL